MIEFRNRFGYHHQKVFYVFPSLSIRHNTLNNCYTIKIDLFKRGYTLTIGKIIK